MHSSNSDSNSSVCMGGAGGGGPHTTKQLCDTSWGSYNLIQSLGSPNLLEQLTELRKPIYPLDYQFIRKDTPGYESTPRWKDTHNEILNKWASVGHGGTQRHSGSPIWKLSKRHPFRFLWSLPGSLPSARFSRQRSGGKRGTASSNLPITGLVPLATSPYFGVFPKSPG